VRDGTSGAPRGAETKTCSALPAEYPQGLPYYAAAFMWHNKRHRATKTALSGPILPSRHYKPLHAEKYVHVLDVFLEHV
jgi:hypothetical protein